MHAMHSAVRKVHTDTAPPALSVSHLLAEILGLCGGCVADEGAAAGARRHLRMASDEGTGRQAGGTFIPQLRP